MPSQFLLPTLFSSSPLVHGGIRPSMQSCLVRTHLREVLHWELFILRSECVGAGSSGNDIWFCVLPLKEIPQQMNGSDCGMFACKYADCITKDKPINFTQVNPTLACPFSWGDRHVAPTSAYSDFSKCPLPPSLWV